MTKFTRANTKAEAEQNIGTDWAKLVKVDGGYMGFETMTDYKAWKGPTGAKKDASPWHSRLDALCDGVASVTKRVDAVCSARKDAGGERTGAKESGAKQALRELISK